MKIRKIQWSAMWCAVPLLCAGAAVAQTAQVRSQKVSAAATENLAAETTIQGTILKYTPNSSVAPLGAHISVQTAAGVVDVHVGDARFLKSNNFTVTEGSAIRLSGQNHTVGTQNVFYARVLSSGSQTVAIRSASGMPLWHGGTIGRRTSASASKAGGAR